MPLTKQYLRYESDGVFNIIASNLCNLSFITYKGIRGRYVAVGGGDDVVIWDLRLAEKTCVFHGEQVGVTYLAASPGDKYLAAGYFNGSIKVFDLLSNQCLCTFAGHKSAITCLTFNKDGQLLASGSQDTDVIVWDIVAEKGKLRLSHHTNEITQVCFMKSLDVLISSSKDKFVSFWDLNTGHCFKTLAAHNSEVWSIALCSEDKYLLTASNDADIYIWHLLPLNDPDSQNPPDDGTVDVVVPTNQKPANDSMDSNSILSCKKMGSLLRTTKGRCYIAVSEGSGHIVTYNGRDGKAEVFYFNSEVEVRKKFQKRILKCKETPTQPAVSVTDIVIRCPVMKCGDRILACTLVGGKEGEIRLAALLHCNKVEMHSMKTSTKEVKCLQELHTMGHRGDISSVCFSSDNLAVMTGSTQAVKIWNRVSRTCIRTVQTGFVRSMCCTPGDRHLLVGQEKKLLIIDIANADIIEEIEAHDSDIWSISIYPDQKGCVTGSGDKTVKFWDFTLIDQKKPSKSNARVLSLLHTRTLQLEEGVLSTCISPNSRHIAVSLLDNTVKIFFFDSLKFFITLYGHKLPILCMDISYDSSLICTGSADRNIKIWGMDFGDCHKSIFAHEGQITSVKFVPKTHYIFSCGSDGLIKQWDADTFERIQTLKGHTGKVLTLAVTDKYVASSGADRVMRLWKCTSEPLVLEDEREEERAQEEEAALATESETIVPGQASHSLPSRKTVGAEKAAEDLMEAMDLATEYKETLQEYELLKARGTADKIPNPPLLMIAMGIANPDEFVFATLGKIRASDMEEALLLLSFSTIEKLLKTLPSLIKLDPSSEMLLTVYAFILKVHGDVIMKSPSLFPVLKQLQKLCDQGITKIKDKLGELVYALQAKQNGNPKLVKEVIHVG